jgi:excisionase family DNA binding protein
MATKFYTVEEVADILRVSTATVRNLIASGELAATQVGRQYRISQESLDDYIRRHS